MKRAIDLVAALIGLLLAAPLLLAVAVAVRLDSHGPVLFRQVRIGRGGAPFRILKFRTMTPLPPGTAPVFPHRGDARVTHVGHLLRRSKLDELPQLINVLRGEMSLVGPRPELPAYVDHYPPRDRDVVLSVRPGITDPASLRFRNEETWLARAGDPGRAYLECVLPRKLRLSRHYVRHRSLRLDGAVVLATFYAMLGGRVRQTLLFGRASARRPGRSARPARPAREVAVGLLWLGLAVGALSVFAAHPLLAVGIWPDGEGIGLAFYAATALCIAGLGLLCLTTGAPLRSLGHPAVLAPGALGVWSLIAAPTVAFPRLSILGAPQNSLGAVWFVGFAAFTASVLVLRRARRLGSIVAITAATALAAAAFNLWRIDWPDDWRPYLDWMPRTTLLEFNEYQAYYGLALIPVGAVLGRQRWRVGASIAAVGLASLLVSRNRAALIAALAAWAAFAAVRFTPAGRSLMASLERDRRRLAAAVAGTVGLIALGSYAVIRLADLHRLAPTVGSRRILLEVLEPSVLSSVRAVLFGHGWGRYADYLAVNLPAAGIRVFSSDWGGLGRDIFHSHHAFLEALFAGGLPGLALAVAIPASVAVGAQRRRRAIAIAFALTWTVTDCFWFMMPATLPALALACGALAESSCRVRWRRGRRLWAGGLIALAGLVLAAGGALHGQARGMTRLAACMTQGRRDACAAVPIPVDPRGAELGLASLIDAAVRAALDPTRPLAEDARVALRRTLAEAERRDREGRSPLLTLALAEADAAIAFAPAGSQLLAPGEALADAWRRDARAVVERAPRRLDELGPYFNWLLLEHRGDDLAVILRSARTADPSHPIVLWFGGIAELDADDPAARSRGLDLMRRALVAGIEGFMPVDPMVKARLMP